MRGSRVPDVRAESIHVCKGQGPLGTLEGADSTGDPRRGRVHWGFQKRQRPLGTLEKGQGPLGTLEGADARGGVDEEPGAERGLARRGFLLQHAREDVVDEAVAAAAHGVLDQRAGVRLALVVLYVRLFRQGRTGACSGRGSTTHCLARSGDS